MGGSKEVGKGWAWRQGQPTLKQKSEGGTMSREALRKCYSLRAIEITVDSFDLPLLAGLDWLSGQLRR